MPELEETRAFWEANPLGGSLEGAATEYDWFRRFDNKREAPDVEPYELSNEIHGYETAEGKRVLDYGCGNGYVLAHYARHGAVVTGVDITEAALVRARRRFDLLGLDGTFVRSDGDRLPFEDASFDIVCSMGVLHHIPDPGPVVAELHRVLAPGGTIIVMVYNRRSFRNVVTFRWLRRAGAPEYRGKPLDVIRNMNDGIDNPLARVYSREELRALLSGFVDHRFRISKLGAPELGLYVRPLQAAVGTVARGPVLRALAERVGWNLYCVARKPG